MGLVKDKIKKIIRSAAISLSYGLRNTESEILGQKTGVSDSSHVEQKVRQNELAEALLRGEVTEEVEKLRDRTYLISDESKKYKVIIDTVGTSKAVKKMGRRKTPNLFNFEGYEICLIMENNNIATGVLESLNSVGGYGIKNTYPLKFDYEYFPKFMLDEYVRKLVIRKNIDDSSDLMLDLYVPKNTHTFERLLKIFDNEITKVKDGKTKPINLEFKSVEFVSNNTFGSEDMIPHKYVVEKFIGIGEFDGKHVLTYKVKNHEKEDKLTDKYRNEKLRSDYENNSPRTKTLNLGVNEKLSYKCDGCGCDINDVYDYRITKETIGKSLCRDCLTLKNKE